MIRRPPRSTRTDTLFPYTTLFRSIRLGSTVARLKLKGIDGGLHKRWSMWFNSKQRAETYQRLTWLVWFPEMDSFSSAGSHTGAARSEERRVGNECVRTCSSRWSPHTYKRRH